MLRELHDANLLSFLDSVFAFLFNLFIFKYVFKKINFIFMFTKILIRISSVFFVLKKSNAMKNKVGEEFRVT